MPHHSDTGRRRISQRKCLNNYDLLFVAYFSFFFQTVVGSGYYGNEWLYRIHIISKLDFLLVA